MPVKKSAATKTPETTLGEVVMVYTKSSSHWFAILEPEFVNIQDITFLRGTQVTGKEGHRMERKRTLIPLEHIASIVEFASEDDLWSEPQPKHIRMPEEVKSPLLTSHEQPQQQQHGGGRHNNRRHQGGGHRHKGGNPRFQNGQDPHGHFNK